MPAIRFPFAARAVSVSRSPSTSQVPATPAVESSRPLRCRPAGSPRRPAWLGACLLGLLCGAVPGGALPAAAHEEELRAYEIDRRYEVSRTTRPEAQARLSATAAWQAFAARDAGWHVRWDEARAVPERLTGQGARIAGVERVGGADVEAASRRFVTQQGGPWLSGVELKLERTIPTGRATTTDGRGVIAPAGSEAAATGWWVHFSQTWQGLPVWGSRLTLRVTKEGRVPVMTNRTYPDISAPTRPTLTAARALLAAAEGFDTVPPALTAPTLAILPIRRESGIDYRLAWKVETRTDEPIGHWISLVDAMDGTLLTRINNARDALVEGVITASVEPVSPDGNFITTPLPYLDLQLSGGWSDTVTTNVDGTFRIETEVTTNRVMNVFLAGPFGRIENMANSGSTPGVGFVAADGDSDSLHVFIPASIALPSESDSWAHAMTSHDHIKTIEPGFAYLDYPMPIRVEIDRNCNAFWDGFGINFFREGGGCGNTGRMATVIMHEYGHAITDFMYRPFFPSGAMHEGFSDYYACIITNQPLVGQGFRGPGTIIRRIDTDWIHPRDTTGESHNDGLIVASALWNVREALGAGVADPLWHFARYGFSDNFDDYFFDYLVTDDDDGNVYNGTPHLDAIAPIFEAHGIGDFSIEVVHAPEPDTEDLTKTFEFRAGFFSIYPLAAGSVQFHATIDLGGETQPAETVIEMTPGTGVREYVASLPAQPAGTTVRYYLTAEDATGTTVTWPPDAPLVFYVGSDTTPPAFVHDPLRDQPIDSSLLRAFAAISDNLDRGLGTTRLTYQRNGGAAEERPLTPRGALPGFEGSIPMDALALGDVLEYTLTAIDSALVPNQGREPASGFHSFRMVRGFGRDFENDGGGGLTGGGQFAWGLPGGSAPPAWSGERLWGASLDAGYSDNLVSTLSLPSVDLTGWTVGTFAFRHWFATEELFDGGSVQVSTDGGTQWSVLTPDGDYNTFPVLSSGQPGWTGRSDGWQLAEFDLSAYLGQPDVRLRLHFESDEAIHGTGWFIDDLEVVERQTLSRPLGITAASGKRNRVPLSWQLPAGIAEGTSTLLGYDVFRLAPEDTDPVRLNDERVPTREFVDATAVNGTPYRYFVSAVYEDGSSPLAGPVSGFPFTAAYAPAVNALDAIVPFGATLDTTITVENTGTGFLQLNAYVANPGQELDDIRYLYVTGDTTSAPRPPVNPTTAAGDEDLRTLGERLAAARSEGRGTRRPLGPLAARAALLPPGDFPADWDTLGTDLDDASNVVPDLRSFRTAVDAELLYLGIDAWAPWGAANEFNLVVAISTDGNSANGFSGGDYLAVAGNLAIANFGIPGILLTSSFEPVDFLNPIRFTDGDSVAAFGVSLAAIGNPPDVTLNVLALDAAGQQLIDRMPDRPTNFTTLPSRYLLVGAGFPASLRVRLNATGLAGGAHEAVLLIDTSDPAQRTSRIPVTVTVPPETSVDLAEFLAEPAEPGVVLRWRTSGERDHVGFHVFRADGSSLVAGTNDHGVRITERLIPAAGSGRYQFHDRSAEPGRDYVYRLADLSRSGTLTFHGAITARSGPALPAGVTLPPIAPNPMRGTAALRYALPEPGRITLRVFGIDGRLVRNLATDVERGAGWHEAVWDGRMEGGAVAPAGLYFVRLEAGGRSVSRKIVRAN